MRTVLDPPNDQYPVLKVGPSKSSQTALVPAINIGPLSAPDQDAFAHFEVIGRHKTARRGKTPYRGIGKRFLDVGLVLATLPLTLSIIVLSALALWIESGRPFYSQKRLGQGGRVFTMFKLRTMVRDADTRLAGLLKQDPALRMEWHFSQKLKKDPRITPIGNFLRRTSIDELPQIWNVLKGDMSLVGPRPMMPEQLPLYGDPRAYFALRPGLSGFWQVSDRNESHFGFRADADRSYDRCVSLGVDMFVLWKTVGAVLRRTGY